MSQVSASPSSSPPPSSPSIGALLQYWRKARRLSQLALAHEADVSPRHVSFLETGRSHPSRQMLLGLATVLDVPFRERNTLLLAAGYAPLYRETPLDAPELGPVRPALDAILRQQEPFPAVVMNRRWDVLETNEAATRLFDLLLAGRSPRDAGNVLRLMIDPDGLRPSVENWEPVVVSLVQRIRREAVGGVRDEATERLLEEILSDPDVPNRARHLGFEQPSLPIVPVRFRRGDLVFDYFSTVTTLGTPQDVTLQEIRIECFFPADPETEGRARALADS